MLTNYIFITGGVVSSLGKGVIASSLASILTSRKLNVSIMKLDPYINIDARNISPIHHGEIFVTYDGFETDMDLGHYERFMDVKMTNKNHYTIGRIYSNVLYKERKGDFIGEAVQVIPHVTNEIKNRIIDLGKNYDITIVEIGGTVGDIESLPFLEAIRQISIDIGDKNTIYLHVTLVPYLSTSKELKTKPTQHSVQKLLSTGIQPNIIICRTNKILANKNKAKISLFCNVPQNAIFSVKNENLIYKIPLVLHDQKIDKYICNYFNLNYPEANLQKWEKIVHNYNISKDLVNVGIVSKYMKLPDAYKSITEALLHAGIKNNIKVNIKFIDAQNIEKHGIRQLKHLDAILIPGGFGYRGIEGKILSAKYAREKKVPYLGICLGMQIAIIEYARNVLNKPDANSTEFIKDCKYPIIALISEWHDTNNFNKLRFKNLCNLNGSMRLGNYKCKLIKNSLAYKLYGKSIIIERHRHRYEVNNILLKNIKHDTLIVSGWSENNNLVEIIEYLDHPWFIASQFHPEFTSTPTNSHPLFINFIKAAFNYKIKRN
ncbi:MAG: CTP synthase [Enterobacterales bacterium]